MAALVCQIFLLHFCAMGVSRDMSSIFICVDDIHRDTYCHGGKSGEQKCCFCSETFMAVACCETGQLPAMTYKVTTSVEFDERNAVSTRVICPLCVIFLTKSSVSCFVCCCCFRRNSRKIFLANKQAIWSFQNEGLFCVFCL